MTADENPLSEVVVKALPEDAFKEQLIADPHATLAAEGIDVPEGMRLKVVEDTESVRHLVMPATGALSEEELAAVDGGVMVRPGEEPCRMIGRDRIWNQVISCVRLGDLRRDSGRLAGGRDRLPPRPRVLRPPAKSRMG